MVVHGGGEYSTAHYYNPIACYRDPVMTAVVTMTLVTESLSTSGIANGRIMDSPNCSYCSNQQSATCGASQIYGRSFEKLIYLRVTFSNFCLFVYSGLFLVIFEGREA